MISKELARAISTGKIIFGYKMVIKNAEKAKAFIMSMDCPYKKEVMDAIGDKPLYIYKGNNVELGNACGKPFGVSVMAIMDGGKSKIIDIIQNR
ncbi:MAG: ribosomal L7Ae/L30e/S12e/Gadd45 family protein [Thermoplasmata archaeon]|nr:ribosomal L7Ae/L30e/S12e/Gadd45 family protein [Thermoplasmata archaeon]